MFRRALAGARFRRSVLRHGRPGDVVPSSRARLLRLHRGTALRFPHARPAADGEGSQPSLAPALENRELLRRYLDQRYVRLRRWIRKYLEYDAVRRIVRRSRETWGWREDTPKRRCANSAAGQSIARKALKHRYREALLKMRRLYERHLRRPVQRDHAGRVRRASTWRASRRASTASGNHRARCGGRCRRPGCPAC